MLYSVSVVRIMGCTCCVTISKAVNHQRLIASLSYWCVAVVWRDVSRMTFVCCSGFYVFGPQGIMVYMVFMLQAVI